MGNELTLGIILALWLLWTAAGSGLFGLLTRYLKNPFRLLYFLQFIIVLLLPLTIFFIRLSRNIFSLLPGEVTSPFLIFIIPFVVLAPIGTLFGFFYTLSCKVLSETEKQISKVPGRVYFLEAIGSGLAGFFASIFFFRYFDNFQILLIVCSVNLMSGLMLLYYSNKKLFRFLMSVFLSAFILIAILSLRLNRLITKKSWGNIELLESRTTIYGNISVTRLNDSISFYENGMLIFTHPDIMYAEESVHFALLEHPAPKKVLLIGGDAAGSLPQILFHPTVEKIDFVLLDPASIALAQKYIPALKNILKNQKINVWYQDGRLFVNKTKTKYDVIIINLPAPQTTLLNRFFTIEFYQSVRKKLNKNGIISFSVSASEIFISNERAEFLGCLYHTLDQAFADVILIPGHSVHYIGSNTVGILSDNPDILIKRIKQRNLPTRFIRDYYLRFRMSQDRIKYINEKIKQNPISQVNRDFHPIGYFYNIYLWMTNFNKKMIGTINDFFQQGKYFIYFIILILSIIAISILLISRKKNQLLIRSIYTSIIVIGCTEISLEILIIHGFQAIYGYAYYQLALIMTGFMIGLAFGSWCSLLSLQKSISVFKRYLLFQSLLTIYPILTFITLLLLSKTVPPFLVMQFTFFILISGVGFIGGYQFPLANHLISQQKKQIDRVGGTLYAWDLFGSVIGALLISTVIIPIFGLIGATLSFFVLNLLILLLLIFNKFRSSIS